MQEAGQSADIESAEDGEQGADDGDKYIIQRIQVLHDGHHQSGVELGLLRLLFQIAVLHFKVGIYFLFMAEYFDDLLSAYHFFDITVQCTDRFLLCFEIFAASLYNFFCAEEHQRDSNQGYKRQDRTDIKHQAEDTDQRQSAGEHIGEAVGQGVADLVDIIRITAHQVAMLMGIEILDRQVFHLLKKVGTHPGDCSLADLVQ